MITHRFPLGEAAEAFRMFDQRLTEKPSSSGSSGHHGGTSLAPTPESRYLGQTGTGHAPGPPPADAFDEDTEGSDR
jgi:hypothetical protein